MTTRCRRIALGYHGQEAMSKAYMAFGPSSDRVVVRAAELGVGSTAAVSDFVANMSRSHRSPRRCRTDNGRVTSRHGAARAPAFVTPEMVSQCWGFAPDRKVAAPSGTPSAAIWQLEQSSHYLENTDLIATPLSRSHYHTYFRNGHRNGTGDIPRFT